VISLDEGFFEKGEKTGHSGHPATYLQFSNVTIPLADPRRKLNAK
jgi:hypothetical protein